MYYGLILLSVVMFGGCFALRDSYRKMRGSGIRISMEMTFVGSLTGLIVMIAVNGLHFEFTPFTFCIALLAAISGFGFSFCSFKALDVINLSMFSLFSMLGGMALPFLQGILFYHEEITVAKVICFLFICLALAMTVTRSEKRKGTIYYIGIFVLNGMSGVFSKIFASAPYEKTSSAGYSIWIAICSIVISGVILLILTRKPGDTPRYTVKACGVGAISGGVNQIANFFLVIALAHVDASVQYPMVTGGVMIASTLICFFGERKPTKKEVVSVILAFIGMLALFVIPI